jgi:phosphatidylinositol glycan class Q protein
MFDQYFQLGERIRKHYLSAGVVFYLATGQFVPPIHRKNLYSLQYSMLPKQRYDIGEVWNRLNEERPEIPRQEKGNMRKFPNGNGMARRHRT